jgi:hypothetical protein
MAAPSSAPRPGTRSRATVLGAFLEGWRRALGAPVVTASLLAATWFLAQPLALAFRVALESELGISAATFEAADEPAATARARELARLIENELGFFGSPADVSAWLRHDPLNPILAGAAGAYAALWLFVSGGILDRFARGRPIYTAAFFAACGVYFVRFLRLAVVIGAAYFALFRWLYPFLFVTVYGLWSSDLSAGDRDDLRVRGVLYALFAVALVLVGAVADFAKVRAVVEDRRGMLGAVAASIRFIRRRPLRALGLYLLNLFALMVILRLWAQAETGTYAPSWLALLVVLLYLVARIWAKLAFMASEVVFFQGELAHIDYTAAPLPVWPDSPEAEAMDNLKAEGRRP